MPPRLRSVLVGAAVGGTALGLLLLLVAGPTAPPAPHRRLGLQFSHPRLSRPPAGTRDSTVGSPPEDGDAGPKRSAEAARPWSSSWRTNDWQQACAPLLTRVREIETREREAPGQVRPVVWHCGCATGVGDRWRGIRRAALFAALYSRPFAFETTAEINFTASEAGVLPNTALLDWRTRFSQTMPVILQLQVCLQGRQKKAQRKKKKQKADGLSQGSCDKSVVAVVLLDCFLTQKSFYFVDVFSFLSFFLFSLFLKKKNIKKQT